MNGDIPTRKGYIFNGWFRYHDDGNWWEKIYDADGIAVKEDTSCFCIGMVIMPGIVLIM